MRCNFIIKKQVSVILILLVITSLFSGCKSTDVNYAKQENWAYLPAETQKEVDLFIIAPTVDMGSDNRFNMELDDKKIKDSFIGALNMELGIYNETCDVYAPFYRQMTLPCYNSENNIHSYREKAYQDVKAAFLHYFDKYNNDRPFIIAGFSQGSEMGFMLMQDLFDNSKYSEQLVAAYLIGWRITQDDIAQYPWITMASEETDTGCVISFNSESPSTNSSLIVPTGTKTLAINPINWKTDDTVADSSLNKGACFTDYSGNITIEIPQLTGAYLDHERGTLKVLDVSSEEYPPLLDLFAEGEYHLYDYQFFFRNLQENVSKRANAYLAK